MANIVLETKLVGLITGNFEIPSYQRGYRWGTEEVTRLLDDVYKNGQNNYCLQPIVVRKAEDKYVLIDGQQRLTTLYLIYRYMNENSFGFISEPKFSLNYVTRSKSADFLNSIDEKRKDENIDFWHIYNAYQAIANWFNEKPKEIIKSVITNINKYFDENVKVIWYEVDCADAEEIALFERLNIGKIPLTSAELVKAMFLSKDNNHGMTNEKQEEIALQWDNIEKELNNESLWYFLNNENINKYQTKIDLVLDLIAEKQKNTREKYFTYFALDKKRELYEKEKADGKSSEEAVDRLWREIQKSFLILKDWYENHELYHKIGYLIASDTKSVLKLYKESYDKNKDEFVSSLDSYIKESIQINDNYADLSYEHSLEKNRIYKLLLLFNVESVRQNGEGTQWFPFDKFKNQKDHKAVWSLEHIHAQNSDTMKNEEHWKEWLRLHIESIKSLDENDPLLKEMNFAFNKTRLEGTEFKAIQEKVIDRLSYAGSVEYEHRISNLALLNTSDNAALNNSTFDVKRNAIIRMDKEGKYIPFCTKMVFLKYYTPSNKNQLHFWGQDDRIAYIKSINKVLEKYLSEPIALESEGE